MTIRRLAGAGRRGTGRVAAAGLTGDGTGGGAGWPHSSAATDMDLAEQLAIGECGNCHRPEREHQDGDPEMLAIWSALGGCCTHFVVSRAALDKVRRQARAPKMAPVCQRCGAKGHVKAHCPW